MNSCIKITIGNEGLKLNILLNIQKYSIRTKYKWPYMGHINPHIYDV